MRLSGRPLVASFVSTFLLTRLTGTPFVRSMGSGPPTGSPLPLDFRDGTKQCCGLRSHRRRRCRCCCCRRNTPPVCERGIRQDPRPEKSRYNNFWTSFFVRMCICVCVCVFIAQCAVVDVYALSGGREQREQGEGSHVPFQ